MTPYTLIIALAVGVAVVGGLQLYGWANKERIRLRAIKERKK